MLLFIDVVDREDIEDKIVLRNLRADALDSGTPVHSSHDPRKFGVFGDLSEPRESVATYYQVCLYLAEERAHIWGEISRSFPSKFLKDRRLRRKRGPS